MPIEFRCTQCDKLLRTPAGTEGKKAKCPQCAAIVDVPQAASAPAARPAPPPVVPPRDSNPFQSPTALQGEPGASAERGFHPTRIELGEVLSRTWEIYKANVWLLVVAELLIGAAIGVAVSLIALISFLAFGERSPAATGLLAITVSIGGIWLQLGVNMSLLKIARGEPVAIKDLLEGGPFLLPALGATILSSLAAAVGFALLIIPGVIVSIMLSQSLMMVIDQRAGVIDSLRLSMRATAGNKLTLFGLWLVAGLGGGLIGALTCGLGSLFVTPFMMLLACVVYLEMTGQKTAANRPV